MCLGSFSFPAYANLVIPVFSLQQKGSSRKAVISVLNDRELEQMDNMRKRLHALAKVFYLLWTKVQGLMKIDNWGGHIHKCMVAIPL